MPATSVISTQLVAPINSTTTGGQNTGLMMNAAQFRFTTKEVSSNTVYMTKGQMLLKAKKPVKLTDYIEYN